MSAAKKLKKKTTDNKNLKKSSAKLAKNLGGARSIKKPSVGIIMGSQSDLPIMKKAFAFLDQFKIYFEVEIVSAHRTPDFMAKYAKAAKKRGLKIIIAGAGGAAHLPGMVASYTSLPVIGVPINITSLEGLDSFLSILQMPKGVPVATVAIDNSENAALLAARILGINSKRINQALEDFAKEQKKKVLKANKR